MKDKADKIKPKIKPVSFILTNETDLTILEFIVNNNIAFSSYVKDLIIKDMRKLKDKNEIAEAINNLANIISNSSFNIVNTGNNKDEKGSSNSTTPIDEEKKNIIGNLLNMSK